MSHLTKRLIILVDNMEMKKWPLALQSGWLVPVGQGTSKIRLTRTSTINQFGCLCTHIFTLYISLLVVEQT